jgi:hypothetical protein
MTNFVSEWNILRARKVFHLRNRYTFNLDQKFHPITVVTAPDSELAALLFIHGVELIKDILLKELNLLCKKREPKEWERDVFQAKSDLNLKRGHLQKFITIRNNIGHADDTGVSLSELEELFSSIENLLFQFSHIKSLPDYNELVWFFDSNSEPVEMNGVFIRSGTYGVQEAKTAKPVYFYTFEVHYKDIECTLQTYHGHSELKGEFITSREGSRLN